MIPRSVSVRFSALMGGFVGPIRGAAGELNRFGRTIDGATGRQRQAFNRLGTTATVAGGLMVAGFGIAVKAAADFDKAMSKVGAVSNATGKDMSALRKAAIDAGRDTQFSATQAAQAEAELAKAGIGASDILGGALRGSLSLAAAGEMDLADAATVSAQAMNIFGLKGKDVTHIADVLAAGANKSAADVKDLAWAMRMGGQVAAQTGLKLEDTIGVLSAFADNALIGSDAGTSLKVMLQHLANPSGNAAGLMQTLGLNVYDANGQFIGMAGLAANLQKALGNLTQEERDAAMATIFGSDAVRGANVLYKIGAKGVIDYTQAVNDNGAASRVASKMMNNLSGDLEKLKGSLETALIQSGSGANGALRTMVKSVDAVVGAYSKLPGGIQSGVIVLTGFTGAALLTARGLLFMRTTILDTKIAIQALDLAALRAKFSLSTLGKVGGAIALIAGVATAFYAAAKASDHLRHADLNVEKLTESLQKLGEAGKVTGELKRAFGSDLEGVTRKFSMDIKGLGDTIKSVIDPSVSEAVDQWSRRTWGKYVMFPKQATDKIKALDKAMAELVSGGHATEAAEAFNRIAAEAAKQGVSMDELKRIFPQYSDAVNTATTSTDRNATAQQQLSTALKSTAVKADELQQKLTDLAGANMSAERAAIAQARAEKRAGDASNHRKGLTLDEREALLDLADADNKLIVALKDQGATGDQLVEKQGQLADRFIKAARAMGLSHTEAEKLARSYGLLDDRTKTTKSAISGFIDKANAAAGAQSKLTRRTSDGTSANENYKASIQRSLPVLYALAGRNQAAKAQVDKLARSAGVAAGKMNVSEDAFRSAARAMGIGTSEAGKLWRALQKIKSKSINVDISAVGRWATTANRKFDDAAGFAVGGPVPAIGPEASRARDSVPAMLRVDEHVWTPEEVDAAGGHAAIYRLRRAALAGELQGYAKGGRVGGANLTSPGSANTIMNPIRHGYRDMLVTVTKVLAEAIKRAMSGGSVVAAARSQIGLPYSWGGGGIGGPSYGIGRGAGTYGFDCSGLTQYAWWRGRHIDIGGTTYEQHPNSRSIGTPRAGALGFPHLGHVVIASGNGTIIQAPFTGSHVQEVGISRSYDWRWPNGAGFAKGGEVSDRERRAGAAFIAGDGSLVDAKVFGIAGDPGGVRRYASGGWVSGHRNPVPVLAEDGEFIINARSAARYAPLVQAINTGTVGEALIRRTVRATAGAGRRGAAAGGGTVVMHVHNHGVISSQAQMDKWLTTSMERLRRRGRLPGSG